MGPAYFRASNKTVLRKARGTGCSDADMQCVVRATRSNNELPRKEVQLVMDAPTFHHGPLKRQLSGPSTSHGTRQFTASQILQVGLAGPGRFKTQSAGWDSSSVFTSLGMNTEKACGAGAWLTWMKATPGRVIDCQPRDTRQSIDMRG